MVKERKPEFIEVAEDHVISTKGIRSIKQMQDGSVEVRYTLGHIEKVNSMSMTELLNKLGRNPFTNRSADSG